MYLFQHTNTELSIVNNKIYIPLCIYFNASMSLSSAKINTFTFHYVSISTEQHLLFWTSIAHLHSTMYLFQLCNPQLAFYFP